MPTTIAALTTTSSCTQLGAQEQVLSVSPEGFLWLTTSSTTTGSTVIRVLDGWGEVAPQNFETPLMQLQAAQARTATTASLVADAQLWQLRDGERISIELPEGVEIDLGASPSLCGDMTESGFLLADGQLLQRAGETWLQWSGLEQVLTGTSAVNRSVLSRDGACFGQDDAVWLQTDTSTGAGAFWKLGPALITRERLMSGVRGAALLKGQLLVLVDGELHVGADPVKRWSFAHGEARALTSAGGYAWILTEGALLRFDGETFLQLDLQSLPSAMYAHAAGGLWAQLDDSVCHVAPPSMVRVRGLNQGQRLDTETARLFARTTEADGEVQLMIKDQAVTPMSVQDDWVVFEAPLELGWNTLSLSSGGALRSLSIKREPGVVRSFQTDIFPIYQQHCSNMACHAPESIAGAPDLSNYDAWVTRADRLRLRVVEQENMPPLAARDGWTEEQVTTINEWLSGGLRP